METGGTFVLWGCKTTDGRLWIVSALWRAARYQSQVCACTSYSNYKLPQRMSIKIQALWPSVVSTARWTNYKWLNTVLINFKAEKLVCSLKEHSPLVDLKLSHSESIWRDEHAKNYFFRSAGILCKRLLESTRLNRCSTDERIFNEIWYLGV